MGWHFLSSRPGSRTRRGETYAHTSGVPYGMPNVKTHGGSVPVPLNPGPDAPAVTPVRILIPLRTGGKRL